MPVWLADLLFWVGAFIALFFLIRFLQKRKKDRED